MTLKKQRQLYIKWSYSETLVVFLKAFSFYKMSCNYADGLSPYHDKGQLGLEEKFDSKSVVTAKVSLLTKWVNEAKHVVIHTGAGISTSAGIPDFRGPRGVWTLQAKGEKPDKSKEFNEAIPTITHMAIMKLVEKEKVKYVVSQNIDGLHLRSNLQRKYLSELHGNMFTEQCSSCGRQFVRKIPAPTVGQKSLNKPCPVTKVNGRPCRGKLHDTILDWEHNLPENDLGMADYHSCLADLSICLGTTMQIVPSGNLPLYTKKLGGKLVIVNLQPTKYDRKADLLIHAYVDEVMTMLMKNLGIKIPKYSPKNDPTRSAEKLIEWTISDYAVKKMKKIYEEKCGTKEARKRLEILDDDLPLSITKSYKRKGKEDEDSDLEVLDVIVKPKKGKEGTKKGSKRNSGASSPPVFNTTITIKKVTAPPPTKKSKYEPAEKITIKKNVTPTKTKYEIVTKPKRVAKCEIVYTDSDLCNDLDMVCESDDDDEMTNNFTYNFRRYLHEDIKKEENDGKTEIKTEIKVEEEEKMKNEVKEEVEEKSREENSEKNNDKVDASVVESQEKRNEAPDSPKSTSVPPETGEPSAEASVKETLNAEDSVSSQDKSVSEGPEKGEDSTTSECPDLATEGTGESGSAEVGLNKREESTSDSGDGGEPSNSNKPEESAVDCSKPEAPTSESSKAEEPPLENRSEDPDDKSRYTGKTDENTENVYATIGSDISSLSNSNLENQIEEMVNQDSSKFESSLTTPTCSANAGINETYEFYNNEYSSSNNPLDYVDNNYYSNF